MLSFEGRWQMADNAPSIVVVDHDRDERALIAAVLRDAGFSVIEAAEVRGALAAINRERVAAAVVALPDGEASNFLRRARDRRPGLEALVVVGPAVQRLVDEDCGTLMRRPFNPRHLLDRAFDLVLREGQPAGKDGPRDAAELGIAAAEVACLDNRRVAAAASGATWLAQDLKRQIGETRALCHRLAAAIGGGEAAPAAGAADG